jgi:membrane-associated protein
MTGTFAALFSIIQLHGYWIMFLLVIVEGPITTAAGAFASSMGLFDAYMVFIVSVLGNLVGDIVHYWVGRIGRKVLVDRYIHYFGVRKKQIQKIEAGLKKHLLKSLTIIKLVPPLPAPGLLLAGMVRVSFSRFIFFCTLIGLFYSLFFTLGGYYLGATFGIFFKYSRYVEVTISVLLIVLLVIWLLYRKYSKGIYRKVEKLEFK